MFKKSHIGALLICLFLVSIVGCSKDSEKKSTSQVAAKVDSYEISIFQVNQMIKGVKNITPESASSIRQQVLEKLIDQQIIVDKAINEKLDRNPEVMASIEAAKKDILSRAYLQKVVTSGVKLSDQDVKKYYADHPELFSERRIYNLQDIGMEKTAAVSINLNQTSIKQKSMQEIADWLKSQNIKFTGGSYNRPAEQIPLEVLPKLQKLQDGEIAVFDVANATHIIKIVNSQDAPIDLAAATPFIKNYFINIKGKQLVDDEMKKYRAEAKIEYMGDFANKESKPVTSSMGSQQNLPAKSKNSDLDKGIAGLK